MIAPAFPPLINGLGDYASKLGEGLRDKGVEVYYAGLAKEASNIPYLQLTKQEQSLKEIISKNQINIVFINFSAFGYDASGLPGWLLKQINCLNASIKLIIFFHELHASSKLPWQKIFWTSKYQKKIIQQLANAANNCLVSCEVMENHLKQDYKIQSSKVFRTGLFSNITPPKELTPWEKRKNQLVVFGTLGRREAVYKQSELLIKFIKEKEITSVLDIGEGIVLDDKKIADAVQFEKLNNVGVECISNYLDQSKYAAISYPNHLLGKSGIFAAYAAHGNVVLNTDNSVKFTLDELEFNKHFLTTSANNNNVLKYPQELNNWYKQRNFTQHFQKIIQFI